ncbi:MAG TPA: GNAT family protein [Candidatus Bathyarchaeia archaeon]|nr:GNAT family protein [Candidatus Bathyarchaeia archaeon]
MLKGKNVNLRIMEKDDAPLLVDWWNDLEYQGKYFPVPQKSKTQALQEFENPSLVQVAMGHQEFIIEKQDGTKIGHIGCGRDILHDWTEIGYDIVPSERRKGYATEAIQIMTDYLFLSKPIPRILVCTDARNTAAIRTAEKAGFRKEGSVRNGGFTNGKLADTCLLGILREEWKEPKILTKTA